MVSILIDYDRIIKPNNLTNILNRIQPVPTTKHTIGLVVFISQMQYETLHFIPKGFERVKHINSVEFINSITEYAYIIYDEHKKICELITDNCYFIRHMIDVTLYNIPNDVTLCVHVSLEHKKKMQIIDEYINNGFCDPYISKISPSGIRYKTDSIFFSRINNITTSTSKNEVTYLLSQINKEKCTIRIRLTDEAIEYLRHISKMGSTMNTNGTVTQKEVSGRLKVDMISDDLTHYITVEQSSIYHGEQEETKMVIGRYNFHSHPMEAYFRNDYRFAWPSATDYLSFLYSAIQQDTILHLVATLEGFYVISLHSDIINKKEQIDKKMSAFILEKYNVNDKRNHYTPDTYISIVNTITYLNKNIFIVHFFSWKEATKSFDIYYHKLGMNCFAKESTLLKQKRFSEK
jgi:hypothetical protein